jgi:hypothetical protein
VLTIARVYRTEERAVETADIIIPVERYSLVYDVPVKLRPPGIEGRLSAGGRGGVENLLRPLQPSGSGKAGFVNGQMKP